MKPTRKQADRFLGHALTCPLDSADPQVEDDLYCDCTPWECRDCGQAYNEDDGHDCPAAPRYGPGDPRD